MIETTLAALAALLFALATVPGLTMLALWTALVFYVAWRWSVRKAANHPEWFARRNAQAASVDAAAAEVWQRIVAGFDRAKG